ncbi:MAG: nucleotidyltransferase domain-containing protein [Clostridiales bacterium]|nr:nucleotidyltransferase domain-containing protein [Clostridiales bacterium]
MCSQQELQIISGEVVSAALDMFSDKIERVLLFGSYARGDYTNESDVDIMIILNCPKEEVRAYRREVSRMASRIGLEHDVMVSILIRDKATYEHGKNELPFYRNVMQEGVELYGQCVC